MSMNTPSPAPGAPQTGTKAVVAAGLGFALAFFSALLQVWTDTDPLSARDIVVAISSGIGSSAVLGYATYAIPNRPK